MGSGALVCGGKASGTSVDKSPVDETAPLALAPAATAPTVVVSADGTDALRVLGGQSAGQADTLGRYRILSCLGRGGMGEGFLAPDPTLRRRVPAQRRPPRAPG